MFAAGSRSFTGPRSEQTAKPCKSGEVNRHVKLKQEPAENGDSRQPGKNGPKKRESGDIPKQKVAQPTVPRIFAAKPNRCEQRRKGKPAKPTLVEGRKATGVKKTRGNRAKPWPDTLCLS